jgi:threonine aldolase
MTRSELLLISKVIERSCFFVHDPKKRTSQEIHQTKIGKMISAEELIEVQEIVRRELTEK